VKNKCKQITQNFCSTSTASLMLVLSKPKLKLAFKENYILSICIHFFEVVNILSALLPSNSYRFVTSGLRRVFEKKS